LFSEAKLNYLVGDLGLTKEKVELLGSRINEIYLLDSGRSFYHYRIRSEQWSVHRVQQNISHWSISKKVYREKGAEIEKKAPNIRILIIQYCHLIYDF